MIQFVSKAVVDGYDQEAQAAACKKLLSTNANHL